jgi:hypothetical protein
MTSPALATWRSSRLSRLDRLLAVHPDSSGSTTDPSVAQEWTQALVLRLASEFQGYCRDLHNDVSGAIAGALAASDCRIQLMIFTGLTAGRALNRSSADPQTLATDFARLGVMLWRELTQRHPHDGPIWREILGLLHQARNGVVHDDPQRIIGVLDAGWVLEIQTVIRWRDLLDEVAVAMDDVVSSAIADLFGMIPWEKG